MPYSNTVLAFVWLLIFGLFALAGSGAVSGSWVLLLILAAGGVPLLLTLGAKPRRVADANVTSRQRRSAHRP